MVPIFSVLWSSRQVYKHPQTRHAVQLQREKNGQDRPKHPGLNDSLGTHPHAARADSKREKLLPDDRRKGSRNTPLTQTSKFPATSTRGFWVTWQQRSPTHSPSTHTLIPFPFYSFWHPSDRGHYDNLWLAAARLCQDGIASGVRGSCSISFDNKTWA